MKLRDMKTNDELIAEQLLSDPEFRAGWERGDVNPGMDTLMRVASGLGIEFTINVRPAGANARLVTKKAQTDSAVGMLHTEQAEFLVAAA